MPCRSEYTIVDSRFLFICNLTCFCWHVLKLKLSCHNMARALNYPVLIILYYMISCLSRSRYIHLVMMWIKKKYKISCTLNVFDDKAPNLKNDCSTISFRWMLNWLKHFLCNRCFQIHYIFIIMVYRKIMNETAYGILKIKVNEKEKKRIEGIYFKGKRGNFLLRGQRRQPSLLYKVQSKP